MFVYIYTHTNWRMKKVPLILSSIESSIYVHICLYIHTHKHTNWRMKKVPLILSSIESS
jgi:hypothetical protein